MAAPLAGIRVLELARILAGPWAGQLLADLGAEVIKVERAGAGDDTRGWGPPFATGADGAPIGAAYFHATNRGKKSIALDFESPEGQATVRALAAESDVLIENFKVGGLSRFGLDHETLSALNPRLIYCSVTGFGQTGPYAPRAGYDYLVQGMGGLMDLNGEAAGEPQKVGVAVADIFTGLYATAGILAALHRRGETGKGARIDMALLDTQVSVLANQALNFLVSGEVPHRMGNAHPNIVPYQVFPAADGHLIVAVGNDGQFARFCAVLGAAEIALDPNHLHNADRVRHRDTLCATLAALTAKFARDDLLARLETVGVPAAPINAIDQVFADPQVIHRGLKVMLPEAGGGTVPSVACPIVMDGQRLVASSASPRLGADTASILAALAEHAAS
ncbi:CaiB/BaiF CoA transferase family protein [Aquabacter spiritensis]|uniref:Crotonobetainyl-CoA:carnitine CoA-transferase CaiB-like acyl-CoA transferase n=1 Tax=Aquabacter spiritensis TaxID=933073 RepID=A0A4R3LRW1_9HYPH|nr:CaiB/BaiF CoA-transferase family protein [Aquabacter spiritensis]TCT03232.1 crotonobetainyl-CoA:carnitine CoA-transferase CaiB-like acyl-CoA transferase [Aquabacter spiritensis]